MSTKRTVAAFAGVALVAAASSYAFNQHMASVERNAYRAGFLSGTEFGFADCNLTPEKERCAVQVRNMPENKYPVLRVKNLLTPRG